MAAAAIFPYLNALGGGFVSDAIPQIRDNAALAGSEEVARLVRPGLLLGVELAGREEIPASHVFVALLLLRASALTREPEMELDRGLFSSPTIPRRASLRPESFSG